MSGAERCDEIVRLIDEVLAEKAPERPGPTQYRQPRSVRKP